MSLKTLYDYRKTSKEVDAVPFTVPRLVNPSRPNRMTADNSTLPPLPSSFKPPTPSSRWSSEPHMLNTARLSVDSPDRMKSSTDSLGFGINPSLYEEASQVDVETNFEKGNIGRLWFSVQYNPETERLVVNLIQVRNLASRTIGSPNACDPFVKVGLIPGEKRNLQSTVKKKTCSTKFEETFVFQLPLADLRHRSVKFSVYDANKGKHHVTIGYVIYPLKLYESYSRVVLWRDLENDESSAQAVEGLETSQLYITLVYSSALQRLTVGVYAGKDFKNVEEGCKRCEIYAVVSLAQVNQLMKSKRSSKVRLSREPLFNETFKLKLPHKLLNSVSLSVSVFMRSSSGKDQLLGLVVLGSFMFARGEELDHWREMVTKDNELIGRWHHLI